MSDVTPASWQDQVLAQLEDDGGFSQIATTEQVKGVFVVKSKSDPMGFYYLIDVGWIVLCTCKSFRFRTECSHARDYLDGKLAQGVDGPDLHIV